MRERDVKLELPNGMKVNKKLLKRAILYFSCDTTKTCKKIRIHQRGYPLIMIGKRSFLVHRMLFDFISGGKL